MIAVVALGTCVVANAQSGDTTKELVALGQSFNGALMRADWKVIEQLEADDLVFTNADGSATHKSDEVGNIKAGDEKFESIDMSDVKVQDFGSVAVVTGKLVEKGRYKAADLSGTYRFINVWAKRNGRWQLVTGQETRYAPVGSTAPSESKVMFFSAKQLDAEIQKVPEVGPGTFRVDLSEYSAAKGGASVLRRTKPYRAEVHKQLVDMWYVIRGEGTLVTGGSLSEPTETEPDEFRGPGITGGEERDIVTGDFVRIPAGVPHWIRKVNGDEFLYLVVKAPQ